jgi:hypothetical protein
MSKVAAGAQDEHAELAAAAAKNLELEAHLEEQRECLETLRQAQLAVMHAKRSEKARSRLRTLQAAAKLTLN